MKASIALPNSAKTTTPLGVGMATLMREPSGSGQQRLLHAAYEAGFRHFDTAPSYGVGAAETVLGRFLRAHRDDVSVGTKVGILARGNASLMRVIQRPARAVLRRFPALRGRATQTVGGMVHARPDFSPATRTRSLEGSLRALRVDALDLLLLHEPEPADVGTEITDWLGDLKRRGLVRAVGVATTAAFAAEILRAHPGTFDAVQAPGNVLEPIPALSDGAASVLRVVHSVLANPLGHANRRMAADPAWIAELSRRAGTDIAAPGALAKLLLAWAVAENPRGIVLLGSSSADHLRAAVAAVDAFAE
ncbi:MAG TPA: aldo/keto reductase, partial [Gemmatimonadaceae bacterium]|nr:aldo/keto reductase [Gemmatimonadaceae bacterium]